MDFLIKGRKTSFSKLIYIDCVVKRKMKTNYYCKFRFMLCKKINLKWLNDIKNPLLSSLKGISSTGHEKSV